MNALLEMVNSKQFVGQIIREIPLVRYERFKNVSQSQDVKSIFRIKGRLDVRVNILVLGNISY